MSKLINPSLGIGLQFGSTVIPGINYSNRAVGYGQVLVADTPRLNAATTLSTPGLTGSVWNNWLDLPAEAAANVRRGTVPIAGIVMDKVPGGSLALAPVNIMIEGYPLCWVRRTAANAAPAIYDAAGSPLSLDLNTTNIVRVLSSGISVITAAGGAGPMKCLGICETAITSTATAVDVAEGAGPFPYLPTGAAGSTYGTSLYGQNPGIMLADVLFDGVRGLR